MDIWFISAIYVWVCVWICVFVCTCVCMYLYACVYLHMYVCGAEDRIHDPVHTRQMLCPEPYPSPLGRWNDPMATLSKVSPVP